MITDNLYSLNNIEITSIKNSDLQLILENMLTSNNLRNHIITFNTDFLRISYYDKDFYDICRNSDLVVADGMGIVLLNWFKSHKKIERITGTELFNACVHIANNNSLRIAFVGSSEDTLSRLSDKFRMKYPSVSIKTISPVYEFERKRDLNKCVLDELREFRPDILLVALGCPRQEKWIHSNKDLIGAKINIGVGAVFDFYSGTKKRAPVFIQRIGMEWFWRLLNEPVRLGTRYLFKDLPFFIKEILIIMFKLDSERVK